MNYVDLKAREALSSYWERRSEYTQAAIDMLKRQGVESLLEIGPGPDGARLADEAVTMAIADEPHTSQRADWQVAHDATCTPWPFSDGQFDAVVALQVWEHLGNRQLEAFQEAVRVARRCVVLSIPYKWPSSPSKGHTGLDDDTMRRWCGGRPWAERAVVQRRAIYRWQL